MLRAPRRRKKKIFAEQNERFPRRGSAEKNLENSRKRVKTRVGKIKREGSLSSLVEDSLNPFIGGT